MLLDANLLLFYAVHKHSEQRPAAVEWLTEQLDGRAVSGCRGRRSEESRQPGLVVHAHVNSLNDLLSLLAGGADNTDLVTSSATPWTSS
jgi:hypothetical protein